MSRTKKIKRPSGKNFLLWAITLGLLVLSVFLVVGNLRIASKRNSINFELKALQARMSELTQEKAIIQDKIFQSNDSNYLEKVAREELNLKKEGESVVAFPVINSGSVVGPQDEEQQNLWQKIMEKIR